MRSTCELRELDPWQFTAELDTLAGIYAAAMNAPAEHLPGRRALMERHAAYPSFRAIVVRATAASAIIAFAYGFHGAAGQWWHDLVLDSLRAHEGPEGAHAWLADSFEIAEVHVQPAHQGRGIGRAMMARLTSGRPERTAVLSTPAGESRASRLYHSLGFADLVPDFRFPGADQPYTIMGAVLPLTDEPRSGDRSASPSRW